MTVRPSRGDRGAAGRCRGGSESELAALGIPVAWNFAGDFAGGYQKEADGSIPKVLEIHENTAKVALAIRPRWQRQ